MTQESQLVSASAGTLSQEFPKLPALPHILATIHFLSNMLGLYCGYVKKNRGTAPAGLLDTSLMFASPVWSSGPADQL
ncbi:MAG TPA: hypothetical protein VME18_03865 [Acidobacteriaceae bacterium]|nr:hypothetical protein [Acidobacteriaceae bacterium]